MSAGLVRAVPAQGSRTLPEQVDLVAGRRAIADVGTGEWLCDPNTGEPLLAQRATGPARLDEAVSAAAAAHTGPDGYAPPADRAALLEAIAERLTDEGLQEDLAVQDSLTSGVPLSLTRAFVQTLPDTFRAAAGHLASAALDEALPGRGPAVRLHRLPWGPAVVAAPWNVPTASAAKKAAFALAAGAPVLVVPSAWAPSGPGTLVHAVAEVVAAAGLPPGVLQVVHGGVPTAVTLAGHPGVRALTFTGSRRAGSAIQRAAADDFKTLQLELGSTNPAVVREDADLAVTARQLVSGFTKLNGQWCESPGAVLVPRDLEAGLAAALVDEVRAQVVLGDAFDPVTTVGPQGNRPQYERVRDRLAGWAAAGAEVCTPVAAPPSDGFLLGPAVVRGLPIADARDETFGPVLTVHAVDSDDEAVRLAGTLHTGLAAYVFGHDVAAATALATRLPAGEVKVNGTSVLDMSPRSAQGFWGGSGVGGHGDAELLGFFLGARVVGSDADGLPI